MTFQERFHSNLDTMRQEVTDFTDSYHAINTQTVDTLGAFSKTNPLRPANYYILSVVYYGRLKLTTFRQK